MKKATHNKSTRSAKNTMPGFSQLLVAVFIAAIFSCVTSNSNAQAKTTLLALSKANHTLAIVNPVTLKVMATVPVGTDPHEVIASADGKTAYVTIYGGGSLHEINVIDLVAQKPLTNIDTRPLYGPHGIEFKAGKVWFTAEGSKAVGSYDPATGKLDWSMGTGQNRTHMLYVTDDGKHIYTTNVSAATVSILTDSLLQPTAGPTGTVPPGAKPHWDWVQSVIPVAKGSEGFDVSPDGRELWAAGSDDGTITIIDIAAKKATGTIDAKITGANRLKFTPDGKRVLVSSLRTGDVFVYDAATHKQLKQISTGHGAAGILIDADGSRAFIGCSADNYVAVIDMKTLAVVNHIDVGGVPDGLAWATRQ